MTVLVGVAKLSEKGDDRGVGGVRVTTPDILCWGELRIVRVGGDVLIAQATHNTKCLAYFRRAMGGGEKYGKCNSFVSRQGR